MNIDREELLARLRKMDEYAFEQLVADIWDQRGWNTSRTGKSKDGGVDVIAKKSTPFSQKQIIQAKRYAAGSTVGSGDIQQYSSLKEEQASADVVVIVTTGTFSNKAQEKASKLNVKLVDHKTLIDMIYALDSPEKLNSLPKNHQNTVKKVPQQENTPERVSPKRIVTQDRISNLLQHHQDVNVIDFRTMTKIIDAIFSHHLGYETNITNRITFCDDSDNYVIEFSTQMSPKIMDRVHDGFPFFDIEEMACEDLDTNRTPRDNVTIIETAARFGLDIEDIIVALANTNQLNEAAEKLSKDRLDGDPETVAILAYVFLNYLLKLGTVVHSAPEYRNHANHCFSVDTYLSEHNA